MIDTPQIINENHRKVKLVVFDLDGTLTASKAEMDDETTMLFQRLLEKKQVAVIGGGSYEKFQEQLLAKLHVSESMFQNLFLFPTTAAAFYRYIDGGWSQIYAEKLSDEEKRRVYEAFEATFKELNYSHPEKIYGELIEDRGTQITFSALGQQAPLGLKERWKKEHNDDKLKIAETLQEYLPDMEVRAAAYTSIDVTHKGIDKEYGINQIKKHLGVSLSEMLFVGDALFSGGNDSAVLRTGVPCIEVKGPKDTKKIIRFLLNIIV